MTNVTLLEEKNNSSLPLTPIIPRTKKGDPFKVKYQTAISIAIDSKGKIESVKNLLEALLQGKDPKYTNVMIPSRYMDIMIKDLMIGIENLGAAFNDLIYSDSFLSDCLKNKEGNEILKIELIKMGIEKANIIINKVTNAKA